MRSEISKCEGRDLPQDTRREGEFVSLNFCESEESEDEERVAAAVTLLCAVPGETVATPRSQRHKEPSGARVRGWEQCWSLWWRGDVTHRCFR